MKTLSLKLIAKIKWLLFHKKWEASTKYCPKCGNTVLGEMATLNKKFCTNSKCNHWFDWKLSKGQKARL
jgi:hypothetical protein